MALELPPQYQGQQAEILRKRKFAEALQAQSMAQMQPRQAGRFVVPPHAMEGVAKLVQALAASKMGSGADQQQQALGQQVATDRQSKLAQALQMAQGSPQPAEELGGGPAMPGNPMGAYAQLAGSGDPALMQSGNAVLSMQQAQQKRAEDQAFRASEAEKGRNLSRELVQLRADVGGDRPFYQFLPSADGYMAGNARTGLVQPVQHQGKNVVPAAQSPQLQGQIALEKAAGKERGATATQAQFDLPRVTDNASNALQIIDQMVGSEDGKTKAHPGFQSYVGATLTPGMRFVEGSDTSNFEQLLNQSKGGAFLEAFNSLKGGGQITEVEGKKATDAITRMNKAQSENEFVKAAREYQHIIRLGVERAQKKTGSYKGPERRGVPDGVDPALWNVMTPEERAAFSQ